MVSVCMIVQNEQLCISKVLNNVLSCPLIREICIVDGGSTDNTLAIIQNFPREVPGVHWVIASIPFKQNFGEQKTNAVKMATQPWVLWIDADEIYDKDIFNAIPRLIEMCEKDGADAFAFNRKTRIDGWLHNIIDPDYQIRFWKNGIGVIFSGRIHESPVGFRKLIKTNLTIQHNKSFAQQEIDNRVYWDMGQQPPPDVVKINGKWVRQGYEDET